MQSVTQAVRRYPILAVAVIATVSYLGCLCSGFHEAATWISIITVTIVIVITSIQMLRDIVRGHYGLDILALVAMIATLAVSEYLAALIIVLMLSGGEALEDYAELRASRELNALLDRSPRVAHRFTADTNSERLSDISVEEVRVGDELLVRPAEVVPVDATLLTDEADLNEASLTGEALPVTHTAGATLLSGMVNGEQAIRIRALRPSAESEYQQIIALVREAQETQAPVVRLADRYAIPFTAVSLFIAGIAWWVSGDPLRFAQVLVLATPCPLLIAAPVAFLGGLSRAARAGIVIKGGSVIEQLADVQTVAFDKTGTLTEGKPVLVALHPRLMPQEEFLYLVASAEQYSSHVLAEGIVQAARDRGLRLTQSEDASEYATQGVAAVIDGNAIRVGKLGFIREEDPSAPRASLNAGEVAAYVTVNGVYAGTVILADEIRKGAPALVAWLREHQVQRTVILSGDASETVAQVANTLGITEHHAELLPADKVRIMRGLSPGPTLMVGDGVNDAPVLATADVGIAMAGSGETAAGEAADAVILNDRISSVAEAMSISSHTLRVALQAIWIGIIMSLVLMMIATTGVIPAVVGALLQEIIDLVAIVYALRTLKPRPPAIRPLPRDQHSPESASMREFPPQS